MSNLGKQAVVGKFKISGSVVGVTLRFIKMYEDSTSVRYDGNMQQDNIISLLHKGSSPLSAKEWMHSLNCSDAERQTNVAAACTTSSRGSSGRSEMSSIASTRDVPSKKTQDDTVHACEAIKHLQSSTII